MQMLNLNLGKQTPRRVFDDLKEFAVRSFVIVCRSDKIGYTEKTWSGFTNRCFV